MRWHQILGLLYFLFFFPSPHLHSHLVCASPFINLPPSPLSPPPCPPDQRDALLHFKHSFVLDSKVSNDSCDEYILLSSYPKTNTWNEDIDCCSWYGVTCDNITGNVVSLDLSCSWLEGDVHSISFLFLLRHLGSLNLFGNNLAGSRVSPNLSGYSKNNSFQGPLPIPPPSIFYFDASDNGFTGKIPSSICQLSSLQSLSLSNNNLSGLMPPCFGDITNLEDLDLSNNRLKGPLPDTLVKLENLSFLVLSHNEFSDIFPYWMEASQLQKLDLQSNKFHGEINFTAFELSFPILQFLFISNNNFIGRWPTKFFSNKQLFIIDLSNNKFEGPIPLPSTETYYYSIASNKITGKIPLLICTCILLNVIDLSNNDLTGTLPRSLVNCTWLEVLDLSDNQIDDTFPIWSGALPNLKVLILRSNNFKAFVNIPKGGLIFPELRILDLSNNNFSGPLPTNLIMNLKGMIQLVKILTIFTTIDLSHNSFQGEIPEVIGRLHSLIGLKLSQNYLTGSIPPTLGNLTNLGWLDLSSNKLSGVIPRNLGDLSSLGYLNLSKNQLNGRIPQDQQSSTFSSYSFSENPGVCGTPLSKACPGDTQPPPPSSSSTFNHEGHKCWFKQKEVWIGYASGIVIGISIAYIAFATRKPKWLAQEVTMLERRAAKWAEKPKRKAIKFHGQ
ncbi:hypothetical protein BT93_H2248 [Corymbia citriodora subsp. variegata]|nr:hypothetical protein BT93_H2248 [Corymbia citriodora subsp. variegata]